jgi:hypothetical protein
MIGQMVSKYKVTGVLGDGGIGVICGAEDSDLDTIRRDQLDTELIRQADSGA